MYLWDFLIDENTYEWLTKTLIEIWVECEQWWPSETSGSKVV